MATSKRKITKPRTKPRVGKAQPSARAMERANANASFKRTASLGTFGGKTRPPTGSSVRSKPKTSPVNSISPFSGGVKPASKPGAVPARPITGQPFNPPINPGTGQPPMPRPAPAPGKIGRFTVGTKSQAGRPSVGAGHSAGPGAIPYAGPGNRKPRVS